MTKLTEVEIAGRLPSARGLERLGDMLVRQWQFPSLCRALEFVKEVVERAEHAGHHPDVFLSFRTVRLELSTHAEGGVTEVDLRWPRRSRRSRSIARRAVVCLELCALCVSDPGRKGRKHKAEADNLRAPGQSFFSSSALGPDWPGARRRNFVLGRL